MDMDVAVLNMRKRVGERALVKFFVIFLGIYASFIYIVSTLFQQSFDLHILLFPILKVLIYEKTKFSIVHSPKGAYRFLGRKLWKV